MPNPLPLGNLARSRRDWTLDTLRYGGKSASGTNNNLPDVYTLSNNAKDGTYLAIWGILAYWQGANPWFQMVMQPASITQPSPNLDFQLNLNAPQTPGYTAVNHVIAPFSIGGGLIFLGNGIDWFMFPDAPIMVLPPNWTCYIWPIAILSLLQWNTPSFANFLWGPYTPAKTPRRTTK